MNKRLLALLLVGMLLLTACVNPAANNGQAPTGDTSSLGGANDSYGENLGELGVYDGQFEEPTQELVITCISGTPDCYQIDGSTIVFRGISQDSVYAISGQFLGNIVIDVGDSYKFDLEMHGFSLICDTTNPIQILSGNEVSLTAKKGFRNYIYDQRAAVDPTDSSLYSAAVYSLVDLEIAGKGELTLVSENNNGIHTKDDLQVKNLTLFVVCADNALKGNDSVTLENANSTLIATIGDGINTTNSSISANGKQRGSVAINGGTHTIYAACDGIDAAYDIMVRDDTTELNIYTDKYSSYSQDVTAVSKDTYYIRIHTDSYQYSVKYYNSDEDFCWVDAQYHSSVSDGRTTYYYYAYPILTGYSKVQFFIYSKDQPMSQDSEYVACTDYLTPNTACDTLALVSRGNQLSCEWTNYTTQIQNQFGPGGPGRPPGGMGGPGGMGEGNSDKGDHSTKGMKAANQILVEGGNIAIKSYDDAMHANNDGTLENSETSLGIITINGGELVLYSNDDGIHADGKLTVNGGSISVVNSYEGVEGSNIEINGGTISLFAKDDGINSTANSGNGVTINNGYLYIHCSGDGIDTNSSTANCGIVFNGGHTVVISTSGGNSAIDTEQGYTYNGGDVLAIMPSGGMSSEALHCQNFSAVATNKNISLSEGKYAVISAGSKTVVAAKLPISINALVIYLGSNSAKITTEASVSGNADQNGVCWYHP